MNDIQEDFMSMVEVLVGLMDEHSAIVQSVPEIANKLNVLKDKRNDIKAVSQALFGGSKGATKTKAALKEELAVKTNILSGVLIAYGHSVSDRVLETQMRKPISILRRTRDNEFYAIACAMYDVAAAHRAELEGYGVNEAWLADMQSLISKYRDNEQNPRYVQIEFKGKREQLKELIWDLNDFLRNELDRAMLIFKLTNFEFYNVYRLGRKVVRTGRRRRKKVDSRI